MIKNLPVNVGDTVSIAGLERTLGEGNDNPFPYACLGNPMGRGAWQAIVHGVTESWTSMLSHSVVSDSL